MDKETIADFEANLKGNLYKIWNRLSSGSYIPPPVKAVAIPKKNGGERILGVPTVADRVAQTVVKQFLEPILEPRFLADSYGYRPGKSALDAIAVTRQRCWRSFLEFDIKGLFDNIDHALLLKALEKHTTCAWATLYVKRWLTGSLQREDGTLVERDRFCASWRVAATIIWVAVNATRAPPSQLPARLARTTDPLEHVQSPRSEYRTRFAFLFRPAGPFRAGARSR